jgi:exodeoxyribonuclease VII large subunit
MKQSDILLKLERWRNEQAKKEGIELYMVISHQTMHDIVIQNARSKTDLLKIKGFKEKKFQKYGRDILRIVSGEDVQANEPTEEVLSVSSYIGLLNSVLGTHNVRVKGEISSLDIRGNYLFFNLKDKEDGSLITCFMWQNNYRLSGVELAEGLLIIVSGFPEVYNANGRLTFKVSTVELVGEGALKKAYDDLKASLEKDGVFALERKKLIPDFPRRIGLITSRDGAVINDFLNNLDRSGFQTDFYNIQVEGQKALPQLMKAIRYFEKKKIDVLVIIRGGGSLESFLPFNNEMIVRMVHNHPHPVVCGLGHHKDEPLIALAADKAVSTPTAVAALLNRSWSDARLKMSISEREVFGRFESALSHKKLSVLRQASLMSNRFHQIMENVRLIESKFKDHFNLLSGLPKRKIEMLDSFAERIGELFLQNVKIVKSDYLPRYSKELISSYGGWLYSSVDRLDSLGRSVSSGDPRRLLRLGYSIVRLRGTIVKSKESINVGDCLSVSVSDGEFVSEVKSKKD